MKKQIVLTGCAGFIGSNFVNKTIAREDILKDYNFTIIDALTYAGRKESIQETLDQFEGINFEKVDIRDQLAVSTFFKENNNIHGIIHFAAESHVDRSIENPNIFVETNVMGTLNLLNSSLKVFQNNKDFRFVHVSTDEVYGSLKDNDPAFTEEHQIQPNSPYSASKASSDLMVRAYFETFNLPTVITRCSNNYGPYQFPEKLIPLMIKNAIAEKPLPVYGDGKNIRDWIYVDDHNEGVWQTFLKGKVGEVYNFGGAEEKKNIDVVKNILSVLGKGENLITYVEDRKGHDWRYAMDFNKAKSDLGWRPTVTFEQGLKKTIEWYLGNQSWVEMVQSK
jgi:dTDP-glucose 4,6-dehydratase